MTIGTVQILDTVNLKARGALRGEVKECELSISSQNCILMRIYFMHDALLKNSMLILKIEILKGKLYFNALKPTK